MNPQTIDERIAKDPDRLGSKLWIAGGVALITTQLFVFGSVVNGQVKRSEDREHAVSSLRTDLQRCHSERTGQAVDLCRANVMASASGTAPVSRLRAWSEAAAPGSFSTGGGIMPVSLVHSTSMLPN